MSSFGFSGTNAHVVVEQAPAPAAERPALRLRPRPLEILALSAASKRRSPSSRNATNTACPRRRATAWWIYASPPTSGRSQLPHRLAVVGKDAAELAAGLAAFRAGTAPPSVASGHVEGAVRPQIAFLFTGHGAQSPGMSRLLYETSEVFHDAIDACARVLDQKLPRGLLDVMFSEGDASPLDRSLFAQPATFAVEYAISSCGARGAWSPASCSATASANTRPRRWRASSP